MTTFHTSADDELSEMRFNLERMVVDLTMDDDELSEMRFNLFQLCKTILRNPIINAHGMLTIESLRKYINMTKEGATLATKLCTKTFTTNHSGRRLLAIIKSNPDFVTAETENRKHLVGLYPVDVTKAIESITQSQTNALTKALTTIQTSIYENNGETTYQMIVDKHPDFIPRGDFNRLLKRHSNMFDYSIANHIVRMR